jgi:hypothetical protein
LAPGANFGFSAAFVFVAADGFAAVFVFVAAAGFAVALGFCAGFGFDVLLDFVVAMDELRTFPIFNIVSYMSSGLMPFSIENVMNGRCKPHSASIFV